MNFTVRDEFQAAVGNSIRTVLLQSYLPVIAKHYEDEHKCNTSVKELEDLLDIKSPSQVVGVTPGMHPPAKKKKKKEKEKEKKEEKKGPQQCLYRKARGGGRCSTKRTDPDEGAMCRSHARSVQGKIQCRLMKEKYGVESLRDVEEPLEMEEYKEMQEREKHPEVDESLERTGHDTSSASSSVSGGKVVSKPSKDDPRPPRAHKFSSIKLKGERYMKMGRLLFQDIAGEKVCQGALGEKGNVTFELTDEEKDHLKENEYLLCEDLNDIIPLGDEFDEDLMGQESLAMD